MQGRRLVGGGVGEQLDLVELVDPQQPPGVAAGRPRLPAEAGGHRGEPQRQVGLVEDLAAPHRGEGHLGGRDGPEVVALDVVGVLLELGQVPGRHHGVGEHQGRRPHLLEGVGVPVEGEGGEGPQQPGAGPAEEGEHRAGQLGAALHVQQAELRADLPVRHPLPLGVRRRGLRPGAGHHVVLGTAAVGRVLRGQVGEDQQGLAYLVLGGVGHPAERPLLVAESAALGGQPLGGDCVTRLVGRADLLGERLHL